MGMKLDKLIVFDYNLTKDNNESLYIFKKAIDYNSCNPIKKANSSFPYERLLDMTEWEKEDLIVRIIAVPNHYGPTAFVHNDDNYEVLVKHEQNNLHGIVINKFITYNTETCERKIYDKEIRFNDFDIEPDSNSDSESDDDSDDMTNNNFLNGSGGLNLDYIYRNKLLLENFMKNNNLYNTNEDSDDDETNEDSDDDETNEDSDDDNNDNNLNYNLSEHDSGEDDNLEQHNCSDHDSGDEQEANSD